MSTVLYPPGPRIGRLDSFLLATGRRDILKFLTETAAEYGNISYFEVASRPAFLLNHPDYIKDALTRYYESFAKGRPNRPYRHFLGEGLLTSEGQVHQAHRKALQPAFQKHSFSAQQEIILEQGVHCRNSWRSGQLVDIMREMKQLTLRVTNKSIFSMSDGSDFDAINDAVKLVLSQFSPFGSLHLEVLARLPYSRVRRIRKAQARLDSLIRRMVHERRQNGAHRGDLLSLLIAEVPPSGLGEEADDSLIRDQALTFFLAGYETMGTALGWTWYLLAKNPETQELLHRELDSVLDGRLPTVADIPRLKFTKMVFSESMRMYPPAWVMGRYLVKDFETAGYVMPAGSIVIISQYLAHHDARFFPEPWKFDPERWTPEAKAGRPGFCYFPFGGGPRGCLGEGLSWIEGTLLIAILAQQWRMHLVTTRPVKLNPRVTLQSKHAIRLKLERRDQGRI